MRLRNEAEGGGTAVSPLNRSSRKCSTVEWHEEGRKEN